MLCLKVHGPRFWFWCLQFDWRRGKTSRWGQVKNNHWNLQKKKNRLFFGGGGESFMGSLQHHQGAQQHNSSSKHDRVCRHCWFALCSSCFWWAEPHRRFVRGTSCRGGGLHDLATHSPPPPPHTLILVPRVISTMDRSWKLYQKGFDPVMTLRQQVPVHWVIHDPKVVRLLLN